MSFGEYENFCFFKKKKIKLIKTQKKTSFTKGGGAAEGGAK